MVHLATELYKQVYQISSRLPKKERLGIFLRIENSALSLLGNGVEAAFLPRAAKLPHLHQLRREIEIAKRLVRVSFDLKIIEPKQYVAVSGQLQELSKMANGWIKSIM